ncbi:MAG: thioredoxin family protein, partial [Aureliella sp.]
MAKAQSILVLAVLLGSAIVAQAADRHLQIVEFTASVCEPCKRMQPVIAKLAGEGWDIRQLDVASQSELVGQFHVKSVPTIVILRDG